MPIQINTDANIEGTEQLAAQVKGVMESILSRFSDRITRVEVHLSDQNGDESGQDDKRCMLEARLEGRQHCRDARSRKPGRGRRRRG